MADKLLINHIRDFSSYTNLTLNEHDLIPTIQGVKDYINGETLRFSQVDADWSTPITDELESGDATLIDAGGAEDAEIVKGIVALVVKHDYNDDDGNPQTYYTIKYWIARA